MKRFYVRLLSRPRRVLFLAAAVPVLLAPGLLRLELKTDGHTLVPPDAPPVKADQGVRRLFGIHDQIVVVVETADPRGIYNAETLRRVSGLTTLLSRLPGIDPEEVLSLANEGSDRIRTGTWQLRPWLDPVPETPEELRELQRSLEEIDVYRGTLVSFDSPSSATAILLGVPDGVDRRRLCRELRSALEGFSAGPDRVHLVGAPVAETLLGTHLLEDLSTLLPLSLLLLAGVFFATFRTWAAVMLPMIEVGACLLMTFALMGWFRSPVYLTTAVLPVILTMVGVADELHVFCAWRNRSSTGGDDRVAAVAATMEEMWRPLLQTGATTAISFLSFAVSPLAPLRAFGIFMSVGVLLCTLWSLTVIPASLVLLRPERLGRGPLSARRGGSIRWSRMARWLAAHPKTVVSSAILVGALSVLGWTRVQVQDGWLEGFAPESAFRRSTSLVNRRFGGTHLLQIEVDTEAVRREGQVPSSAVEAAGLRVPGHLAPASEALDGHLLSVVPVPLEGKTARPDSWSIPFRVSGAALRGPDTLLLVSDQRGPLDQILPARTPEVAYAWTLSGEGRLEHPAVLQRIGAFERFLQGHAAEEVGMVLGPARHLATMNFLQNLRRPGSLVIPESRERTRLVLDHYRLVRGERRLRQIIDSSGSRGLVTLFLKDANFVATGRLMKSIEEYGRTSLAPAGISLVLGGDVAVSQAMIRAIVGTQTSSLILSVVGVMLVTGLLMRSLAGGLLTAIPAGVSVVITFAVMGWLRIPLGVATSMFAATTVGIGVDYAIHLVERFRRLRRTLPPTEAAAQAVAVTGPPIVIDAVAVGLGFGILMLSRVPPNARLGLLVSANLATCLAATLLLLPALLPLWSRREGR